MSAPTRVVRTGNVVHVLGPPPPLRAAVSGPYDRDAPLTPAGFAAVLALCGALAGALWLALGGVVWLALR